jgi:dynein heavy chain
MDALHILFKKPLDPVSLAEMKIHDQMCPFVMDSFQSCTITTIGSPNFLEDIKNFNQFEKDSINEETIELLEPYLTLKAPDGK